MHLKQKNSPAKQFPRRHLRNKTYLLHFSYHEYQLSPTGEFLPSSEVAGISHSGAPRSMEVVAAEIYNRRDEKLNNSQVCATNNNSVAV